MAHAHSHASAGDRHSRSLLIVLAITAAFMVVEIVAAILTDSLVLLADAGHMLTDVAGVALALGAIHYARRPANQRKTYGYYRAEILAALANAVLLLAVAGYIFYESFQRFSDPPEVESGPLLVVATGGLIVNVIAARILHAGAKESINVRGAFLEVWKDILGSVAAIAAAVIMLSTGWRYADPILAAAVGALILPRTWDLLRGALDVLFEGAPSHMDTHDVSRELMTVPGVTAVHDLHVWTVTSGFVSVSAHIETDQTRDQHDILVDLRRRLSDRFNVDHATLQIETHALHEELEACCGVDAGQASVAHAGKHL